MRHEERMRRFRHLTVDTKKTDVVEKVEEKVQVTDLVPEETKKTELPNLVNSSDDLLQQQSVVVEDQTADTSSQDKTLKKKKALTSTTKD